MDNKIKRDFTSDQSFVKGVTEILQKCPQRMQAVCLGDFRLFQLRGGGSVDEQHEVGSVRQNTVECRGCAEGEAFSNSFPEHGSAFCPSKIRKRDRNELESAPLNLCAPQEA